MGTTAGSEWTVATSRSRGRPGPIERHWPQYYRGRAGRRTDQIAGRRPSPNQIGRQRCRNPHSTAATVRITTSRPRCSRARLDRGGSGQPRANRSCRSDGAHRITRPPRPRLGRLFAPTGVDAPAGTVRGPAATGPRNCSRHARRRGLRGRIASPVRSRGPNGCNDLRPRARDPRVDVPVQRRNDEACRRPRCT